MENTMRINRPALKKEASQYILQSKPSVILVSLAYIVLSVFVSYLSFTLLYGRFTEGNLDRFYDLAADGKYDYAVQYMQTLMPSSSARLIDFLLMITMSIVNAGYIVFLLNTIRRTGACLGNLLDGFGFFLKIIALNLLQDIFISLWSMLFIVPGVIAAYRYRMAIYLLCDDPSLSPLECIRESKRLMAGHKGELFMLDLSLLGWVILAEIPYIGYAARLWTVPYVGMVKALYYDRLLGRSSGADYTDYSEPYPPQGG